MVRGSSFRSDAFPTAAVFFIYKTSDEGKGEISLATFFPFLLSSL